MKFSLALQCLPVFLSLMSALPVRAFINFWSEKNQVLHVTVLALFIRQETYHAVTCMLNNFREWLSVRNVNIFVSYGANDHQKKNPP